jgi:hypothetical protein
LGKKFMDFRKDVFLDQNPEADPDIVADLAGKVDPFEGMEPRFRKIVAPYASSSAFADFDMDLYYRTEEAVFGLTPAIERFHRWLRPKGTLVMNDYVWRSTEPDDFEDEFNEFDPGWLTKMIVQTGLFRVKRRFKKRKSEWVVFRRVAKRTSKNLSLKR